MLTHRRRIADRGTAETARRKEQPGPRRQPLDPRRIEQGDRRSGPRFEPDRGAVRGARHGAPLPADRPAGDQRDLAHRHAFEPDASRGMFIRHRRKARRCQGNRHAGRRWRRQHGDRSRHSARSLGGDNTRGELGFDPRSLGSLSLTIEGLGKRGVQGRFGRLGSQCHFIVTTRQIGTTHTVVAGGEADHGIDAGRVLAQRLAIRFERERDIAQRELGIALGQPEIGGLPARRQRRRNRAHREVAAAAAGGRREHGNERHRDQALGHISLPR